MRQALFMDVFEYKRDYIENLIDNNGLLNYFHVNYENTLFISFNITNQAEWRGFCGRSRT